MKTSEQNKQRRAESLETVRECLGKSQIAIITDYRGENAGLTVKAISELRKKLREQNAEYRVAKNTLIRKALHEINITEADKYLEGPTAMAYGYGDMAAAAKVVVEFAKAQKPNNIPVVKAAIMDGRLVEIDELNYIASLPTLEVLRMQLLGLLLAPHRNIMGVLKAWNEKREGGSETAEAPAEA